AAEAVDAVVSLLRGVIRSISRLTGCKRMLVGGAGRALGTRDSGFSALVGVLDGAVVGGGFGIEIVGLLDDRSGLGANVILGRATDREGNDEGTGYSDGTGRFYFCMVLTGRAHSFTLLVGSTATELSQQSSCQRNFEDKLLIYSELPRRNVI